MTEDEMVGWHHGLNGYGFGVGSYYSFDLHFGRKVMTNLDSILKSRDITLPTKVHLVKPVFSSSHVWM